MAEDQEETVHTTTPASQVEVDKAAEAASKVPPSPPPQQPVVPVASRPAEKPSASFLKQATAATGYKESDIDSFNERTRVFSTTNGGKYQLLKSGKRARRLQGPYFPNELQSDD